MTLLSFLYQGSSIDRGQRPFDSPRRPQRIREKGFGNSRSRRSQNLRRIPGWHSDHPQNRRRRDDPIGGYDKAYHLCSYGHEQSAWALQVLAIGGVGINQLWQCQSDISTDHTQSQINLITKRKSSWDFIIYSRANPTFPIVKYRSFLFLFLLPIHYNVNKGCGTTVNDMVLPLFPFTCIYILWLCTLWPYVRLAFPKFVVTDPPSVERGLHALA